MFMFRCSNVHGSMQVGEEVLRWAMSTPNQVAPLAEVIKMQNRLSMDALTFKVCARRKCILCGGGGGVHRLQQESEVQMQDLKLF